MRIVYNYQMSDKELYEFYDLIDTNMRYSDKFDEIVAKFQSMNSSLCAKSWRMSKDSNWTNGDL